MRPQQRAWQQADSPRRQTTRRQFQSANLWRLQSSLQHGIRVSLQPLQRLLTKPLARPQQLLVLLISLLPQLMMPQLMMPLALSTVLLP